MKKQIALLLALLMLCAACGKNPTADNNPDTPPDIGGDITPDNPPVTGDDITPPEDSGDNTPVYTPIPDDPNKTYDGYTLDIPAAASAIPPESMPIAPLSSIACFIPLPIVAPKPIRGTDTPQPNTSNNGS